MPKPPRTTDTARLKLTYNIFLKAGRELAKSRDAWVESCFALGDCLLAAREKHQDNKAFGEWLTEQKIDLNDNTRAALLNVAKHRAIALDVAKRSESLSIEQVWRREVRPLVRPPSLGRPQDDHEKGTETSPHWEEVTIDGDAREQQLALADAFPPEPTGQIASMDTERTIASSKQMLRRAVDDLLELGTDSGEILAVVREQILEFGRSVTRQMFATG